jgi:hypothetical protein
LREHAICMGQIRNALKHLVRNPKRKEERKKTAVSPIVRSPRRESGCKQKRPPPRARGGQTARSLSAVSSVYSLHSDAQLPALRL